MKAPLWIQHQILVQARILSLQVLNRELGGSKLGPTNGHTAVCDVLKSIVPEVDSYDVNVIPEVAKATKTFVLHLRYDGKPLIPGLLSKFPHLAELEMPEPDHWQDQMYAAGCFHGGALPEPKAAPQTLNPAWEGDLSF